MHNFRKRFLALTAATVAAALTLTGCGNGGGNTDIDPADNSAIVIIDSEPETLNPGLTTTTTVLDIQSKIFEGLVWIDNEGLPQPQLASEWTVSADELTYTFKLRSGVTWHDGEPFTADDVLWSFQEGLKENARAQGVISKIESITAPDASTVVFQLQTPYAPFLYQMKVFDTPILPKHVYGEGDLATNEANRAPVGTGPFKFSEWVTGQKVTVVKNESYWTSGEPKLNEVIFQIIPESQNRINAILTGEADVLPAMFLPQANVDQLVGKDGININKQTAIPSLYFMFMNTENEILKNKDVRHAIAQAVDRERIVEQAMGGLAIPGYGAWGAGFDWAMNKNSSYDKLYPFDTAKAKDAITKAGLEGSTLNLTYDANRVQWQATGQIIKDNLAQIGINVVLEPLERSVWIDKVFTQRNFDLALQSFTSSGDPAIGYHRMYRTNTSTSPNVNPTGYSDAKVDELMITAGGSSDRAERSKAYQEAQAIIDEALPILVLFDEQQADLNLTRLAGMYAGQNPSDQFQKVYVTK